MEEKEKSGYSASGRRLRPRISGTKTSGKVYGSSEGPAERKSYGEGRPGYGERKSYGDRPRYNGGERKSYGDRPGYNSGERRSYGDRPGYNSGKRRSYGDRPSYNNGERRSYGDRPGYNSGERKNYGDRPSYNSGERRSYGDRPNYNNGERKSYGDRPGYGEHKSFGHSRPQNGPRRFSSDGTAAGGEHRSFGGERRGFGGDRRNFSGKPGFGRKPGFGSKGRRNPYEFNDESGINDMIARKPLVTGKEMSDFDQAPATEFKDTMRLNRFIANSGVCSRREADQMIEAGVVTVNGEVVTQLGTKINVLTDVVKFNDETLKGEDKVYLVMNKPKGYVTSATDPHAEKTVMELVKNAGFRVFPVGRLDKNTTGVLLFTNDGDVAERLTHPSYDKKKIYQVIVDHPVAQEDFDKILEGVTLGDGEVKADELQYIDAEDHRKIGIEIHSGKNRIVRRIFESLGYDVKALDRVYFAGLTKKGLKKGEWRFLTEGEANVLKMGAYV